MSKAELNWNSSDSYGAICSVTDGCLVCGDVAVPVMVVKGGDSDALCEDPHGRRGIVGVDLVAPVSSGECLLVHGGVAIARLEDGDFSVASADT